MNVHGESFGEKVSKIMFPLAPFHDELLTGNAIADPMVLHFYAFRAFWFEGIVSDALGTFIVCEYVGRRLGVPEVF